jgi:3-phosphoshikimate 1-carboxyvinyltransferase
MFQNRPIMQLAPDCATLAVTPPSMLNGAARTWTVALPASKSISNRALLIHALSDKVARPDNISVCDDTEAMLNALGSAEQTRDVGAAGTAMRFMTAYLAVTPGTHIITGSERMKHRPIAILVDALRALGATIEYEGEEGFPPLRITGEKHAGGTLTLAGNVSSQYISALLMIGPTLEQGLTLILTGEIVSRPYIEMTMRIMRDHGATVAWTDDHTISVSHGCYQRTTPYEIENDWSAASYWYEICSLGAFPSSDTLLLPRLYSQSSQGDSAVSDLFANLGVTTEFTAEGVLLRRNAENMTSRLDYDFCNQPDLAQTFVVTCLMHRIPFRFTGLHSLRIKETDRIEALEREARKLGYVLHDEQDSILTWNGETCAADALPTIDTYEDHRMAMAFAPCCLKTKRIAINHPQVVTKSYPGYWTDLQTVGFEIKPL